MMIGLKRNTKYTWLKTSAYLILCLLLLFSVLGAGIAGNILADEDTTVTAPAPTEEFSVGYDDALKYDDGTAEMAVAANSMRPWALDEKVPPRLPLWFPLYPRIWLHSHAFLDEASLCFLAKVN